MRISISLELTSRPGTMSPGNYDLHENFIRRCLSPIRISTSIPGYTFESLQLGHFPPVSPDLMWFNWAPRSDAKMQLSWRLNRALFLNFERTAAIVGGTSRWRTPESTVANTGMRKTQAQGFSDVLKNCGEGTPNIKLAFASKIPLI